MSLPISWSILGPYSYSTSLQPPTLCGFRLPVYHKLYRRGIMSLGIRPILRPVVWSDVDSNGKLKRRDHSVSSDDDAEADHSFSRKKMKAPVHTSLYRPPPLSPSETVWSKRCEFLFQRGYQLRPRYQPQWNASLLGKGMHSITAEDHIMQIVCVFHSCILFMLVIYRTASSGPRCNPPSGWPRSLCKVNSGPPKSASNQNFRSLFHQTHDERYTESCCSSFRFLSGLI